QLEKNIVDTPDFQRLRGLRQLGPASMVYPTANHTRFEHSLGTLAVADRIISTINDRSNKYKQESGRVSDEQRALARLYALLHDVTHVPFGHTVEDELKIFERHDQLRDDRF